MEYNHFDKDFNKFDVRTYEKRESLDGTAHYRATHRPSLTSNELHDAEILHEDFKKFEHAVKDKVVNATHKIGDKLHKLKEKFSSQEE
uniref:Uncharacterized protein n=1 Tax=Acrobeloides nanus TaxID=290746 RepID=A0A914EJE5_9BILA